MNTNTVIADIDRIEATLRRAGISVGAFCVRIGVSRATWQRWKSGRNNPAYPTWIRILEEATAFLEIGKHD